MTYLWIVSVPAPTGESKEHAQLTRATQQRNLSTNHEYRIPLDLKVGTLDSLISLSDELSKMDTVLESFTKKLHKSYTDLASTEIRGVRKFPTELTVADQAGVQKVPIRYVQEFKWDRARYPTNSPLKELASSIAKASEAVNKSLADRLSKLTEARAMLQAIDRKEGGSLMMRSLGPLVDKKDIIEGEYLTSFPVVVAKSRKQDFLDIYESIDTLKSEDDAEREEEEEKAKETARQEEIAKLEERALELRLELNDVANLKKGRSRPVKCSSVVPNSAKLIYEDEEYCLFRVVVLKKGAQTFKNVCRNQRYNVREFDQEADVEDAKNQAEEKEKLKADVRSTLLSLLRWCGPQYSDLFASWIHLKAIRTFVESVLRYGLPVNFISQFIEPTKGKEKLLRRTLSDLYRHLGGSQTEEHSNDMDFTGLAGEFYPYVYLSLTIGDDDDTR